MTFAFLLPEILKSMGHDVDVRKVMIGEELYTKYDFAFCGVCPLSSITAGNVPETHYVMDVMPHRHAIWADDWSFCGFGDSVRYTLNKWDKYLLYKKFKYSPEIIEKTRLSFENMMDFEEFHNAPVLAPMFQWGDHQFLMRDNYKAKLVSIDPSPWVKYPTIKQYSPDEKIKQWVMAALSDHSRWVNKQGLKLPVLYCGNKRMEGTQVHTEDYTIQLFAKSFGVLSCGYPSAGSGWWRTRYLNAAWAESLVYSDSKDAAVMGKPYQGEASYFENVGTGHEYEVLVGAQNDWLQRNIVPEDTTKRKLERLMKK